MSPVNPCYCQVPVSFGSENLTTTDIKRPMDAALRARLHLSEKSRVKLRLFRATMDCVDMCSRVLFGKAFFSLRETENLIRRFEGLDGNQLVHEVLRHNGGTTIVPHGLENIPASGPVIIAATHPTGMFDFLAHAGAILHKRPDLKVVANQETERFLGPESIIPVQIDKQNRALSAGTIHAAMKAHVENGGALLIFGSGRVPGRKGCKLVEPEWRSGASRISKSCQVPIIPAALNATNSGYYYRIRTLAQYASGGDDNVGAMVASLRYASELLEKLGGRFEVFYDEPQAPGTAPHLLKARAERLVPGLYASA